MALLTPCLGRPGSPCGIPSPRGGCEAHRRERERAHHNRAYDSGAYRRFRARVLREHIATFGPWCPGDGPEHPEHVSFDLTLDHRIALVSGGALMDRGNVRILCSSRNSALGGRIGVR